MRTVIKPIAWVLILCLVNNPIAGYQLALDSFFAAIPSARADTFTNQAQQGQLLGNSLRGAFIPPSVNQAGNAFLNNGKIQGETILREGLFQQIQPGSLDDAKASYGDAPALSNAINAGNSNTLASPTQYGEAYRTLLKSQKALPSMRNDPIWQQSDATLNVNSPLLQGEYTGCTKYDDYTERSCTIHHPDYKTCTKRGITQACDVQRIIKPLSSPAIEGAEDHINSVSFSVENNGTAQSEVTTIILINQFERITFALLTSFLASDGVSLRINGKPFGSAGNCDDQNALATVNLNIKPLLVPGINTFTLVVDDDCVIEPESWSNYVNFQIGKIPDFDETFIDTPAGCRSRILGAWPIRNAPPQRIKSEDPTNELASTDWWQCTDADFSRRFDYLVISNPLYSSYLGAILPEPKPSPAPVCYHAITRFPGHVTMPCINDVQGYTVCDEFDYDPKPQTTCDNLEASCFYADSRCTNQDLISGQCAELILTYDCGYDQPAKCEQQNATQTVCHNTIRCMGSECIDQRTESNDSFIRAATALQTLNQAQQQSDCSGGTATCRLFQGNAMSCQIADMSILGKVDCCNMPLQASWIDYMQLASATWELTDTSVEMYAIASSSAGLVAENGAWTIATSGTIFEAPVSMATQTWEAVTQPFTSAYESVMSMLGEEISEGVSSLSLQAIQAQVVQQMGEWIASTFGEAAALQLFGGTGSQAAAESVTGQATYTYAGSMVQSIVNVFAIAYAIYQIAKMVVQLVFACTKDEVQLSMLKAQRMCTDPSAIGSYCSHSVGFSCVARRLAFCCFGSPFSRIFQEQARMQLDMDWGSPEAPNCQGLSIDALKALDFDQMNFSEWIWMMKGSGQLPIDSQAADTMYDSQIVTTGKIPSTQKFSVYDRIYQQHLNTSDPEAVRDFMLNQLSQ